MKLKRFFGRGIKAIKKYHEERPAREEKKLKRLEREIRLKEKRASLEARKAKADKKLKDVRSFNQPGIQIGIMDTTEDRKDKKIILGNYR